MLLLCRRRCSAPPSSYGTFLIWQALLDVHLDVAEHIRDAPAGSIPVIIGKGGANIKRLQSESGAQVVAAYILFLHSHLYAVCVGGA